MYRMLVGSLGNSSNASASDDPGGRAGPSSSYSLCELFLASLYFFPYIYYSLLTFFLAVLFFLNFILAVPMCKFL